MELAKIHYDQVGYVVFNVYKALGNVEIKDVVTPKPKEIPSSASN